MCYRGADPRNRRSRGRRGDVRNVSIGSYEVYKAGQATIVLGGSAWTAQTIPLSHALTQVSVRGENTTRRRENERGGEKHRIAMHYPMVAQQTARVIIGPCQGSAW